MKQLLFTAFVALWALTGCKKNDPADLVAYDTVTSISTIEGAKTYFARQLAGGVLVKTSVTLTDKTPGGWRFEFTGGSPATIDLMNGSDPVKGLTPMIHVRQNPDGSTSMLVDDGGGSRDTGLQITPSLEEQGDSYIAPKMDVHRNDDGTLTVRYNDVAGYPDDCWKSTGFELQAGAGIGSEAEKGPVIAVIDNEARGVIAVWLNDEAQTSYTFDKFSPAYRFNIFSGQTNILEGESAEILFAVSSSEAWIPTGAGEWIDRWELNDPDTDTRAGYVQRSENYEIASILPSGRGQGEYIATIRSIKADLNKNGKGEVHTIVLNTNTAAEPKLVSSTQIILGHSMPVSANCLIVKPNSSVDITMAQVIKEYMEGWVSAPRISNNDNVTADWVWSDKPGMTTSAGVVTGITVMTPPNAGQNTNIRVYTGSTEGNAVIAAKVNGIIVWSWHIWVTDYDPETQNKYWESQGEMRLEAPDAGKKHYLMDRNLGALSNTYVPGSQDYSSFGLFYQWGRKDPLIGAEVAQLHNGTLPTIYTPDALGGKLQPVVHPAMTAGIRYSMEHPEEFISTASSLTGFVSWTDMSTEAMALLWYDNTEVSYEVTKSIYDPCPAGWRLPAKGVLEGFNERAESATVEAYLGHPNTPYGYIPYAGYVDNDGVVVANLGRYAFYTSQKHIPMWYSEWKDGVRYETTGGSQKAKAGANTYSVRCIKA